MARWARHPTAAERKTSHQTPRTPGVAEQIAVAWAGVTLLGIAAAGLQFAPSYRLIWIILLVFGAATIPQVIIWWTSARRNQNGRRRP